MVSFQAFDFYTDRITGSPVDIKEKQRILPIPFLCPQTISSEQFSLASRKISHLISLDQTVKAWIDNNLSVGFLCSRFRFFATICNTLPLDNSSFTIACGAMYCIPSAKSPNSQANKLKTQVNNKLKTQVNKIEQIEEDAKHLESQQKAQELYQELIDAIADIESYSNSILYSTSEQFFQGMDCLEQILPHEFLDQVIPHQKLEKLKNIASLGVNFLTALNCGSQGYALLCRNRLLKESKDLLKRLEVAFVEQEGLSKTKLQEIQAKIKEWKAQIQSEEETLTDDKSQFKWDATSNILNFLTNPISYLPKEWLHIATHGHSWMTSVLAVITTVRSLKEARQAKEDLDQWVRSYQEWQNHYQSKCFKTKEENLSPSSASSLLDKRQAIMKKKILQLRPLFHTVEDKIKCLKRQSFARDIQRLLERIKDPCCHFQEIEEIFNQWKFFEAAAATQNMQLIAAFAAFKKAQQESYPFSLQQQELIQTLNQWVNNSVVMDQQFHNWFCTQDKENLLAFYVDHEEVIEHVTKNALKQMTAQKHALEKSFFSFNFISAYLYFGEAVITLAVGLILALMGLSFTSFGGTNFILCLLSIGSYILNFCLSTASSSLFCNYRSFSSQALNYTLQTQIAWLQLRKSIQAYSHHTKEKKLLETTRILSEINSTIISKRPTRTETYSKVWINYWKAKLDCEQSQKKLNDWTQRLKELESKLQQEKWRDFAQYASLQTISNDNSFDTLSVLAETLQTSDLQLLSIETKTLLQVYLGINLETLQVKTDQEPQNIKNALQEFFILDDAELLDFIKNQRLSIKKNSTASYDSK